MSVCQAFYLSHYTLIYCLSRYSIAALEVRPSSGDRRRPLCDHQACVPASTPIAFPSEIGEFADEVRQVFLELGRAFGSESLAGECSPPLDVYETDDTLEIARGPARRRSRRGPRHRQGRQRADRRRESRAPGAPRVELSSRRARLRPLRARRPPRTARATPRSARATLVNGELRVSVPKIADRRGTRDSDRASDGRSTARRRRPRPVVMMRAHPLHRRHRRPARPRAGPARAGRRSSTTTASTSSSPTPRTPPPASASRARSATSCSTGAST